MYGTSASLDSQNVIRKLKLEHKSSINIDHKTTICILVSCSNVCICMCSKRIQLFNNF